MDNEIIVSIICNAFNQQDYIRNALDGFVMQQTDFPFEILVHDDASTDRTPQIIREYEEKYPHLFRPIYQTENQYSKRVGITRNIQVPGQKVSILPFAKAMITGRIPENCRSRWMQWKPIPRWTFAPIGE